MIAVPETTPSVSEFYARRARMGYPASMPVVVLRANPEREPEPVDDETEPTPSRPVRTAESIFSGSDKKRKKARNAVWDAIMTLECVDGSIMELKPGQRVKPVLKLVSEATGIPVDDMCSRSQLDAVTLARNYAMWKLNKHAHVSLKEIGRQMNRDHSTVLHAVRRIDVMLREARP